VQKLTSNDELCRAQPFCKEQGHCTSYGAQCVVGSNADCRLTKLCKNEGRCTAQRGECVAAEEDDCGASRLCVKRGRCFLNRKLNRCEPDMERFNNHMWRGGIAAASIGGAGVIAGIMALTMTGQPTSCTSGYNSGRYCDIDETEETVGKILGASTVIAAGLGVIASIPMIVIGRKKIMHDDDGGDRATAAPELQLGPTGGSLKWEF
jgi:hypothetical protein